MSHGNCTFLLSILCTSQLAKKCTFILSGNTQGLCDTLQYKLGSKEFYSEQQVELMYPGLRLKGLRVDTTFVIDNETHKVPYKCGMVKTKCHPTASWPNPNGIAYGIFEIKAKIPNGLENEWDAWPAFWLYNGANEIDIIDNIDANPAKRVQSGAHNNYAYPGEPYSNWMELEQHDPNLPEYQLINYSEGDKVNFRRNTDDPFISYKATGPTIPTHCGMIGKISNEIFRLDNDYHLYSASWTPNKLTFYLDGRELYTLDSTKFLAVNAEMDILITIQGFLNGPLGNSFNYDIEFLRVWQPKSGYTYETAQYKDDKTWMNEELKIENELKCINGVNSITNEFENNVIYYINDKNEIVSATFETTEWVQSIIGISTGENIYPDYEPKKDLYFKLINNLKTIFYTGVDNRIHKLENQNGIWSHSYLLNPRSINASDYVKDDFNCVVIDSLYNIYYIGQDSKIHILHYNQGNYTYILPYNSYYEHPWWSYEGIPIISNFAINDINIDRSGNIIYKGKNLKLHLLVKDLGGYSYNHFDNDYFDFTTRIKEVAGSITSSNNNEYYIVNKNNSNLYKYTLSNSSTIPVTYTYGIVLETNNQSNDNVKKIKSNIKFDRINNRILYRGHDSRFQFYYFLENYVGHEWVDDYWNTFEYMMDTTSNILPSINHLVFSNFNELYAYIGNETDVRYFEYKNCENINNICLNTPPEFTLRTLNNNTERTSEPYQTNYHINVYPNPITSDLIIKCDDCSDHKFNLYILDYLGNIHFTDKKVTLNSYSKRDISLVTGMYIIVMSEESSNNIAYRSKLIVR